MKKTLSLASAFSPESYKLAPHNNRIQLLVMGRKTGRPNKRLTFHQKGLKITSAEIIYKNKNKLIEHEVVRINHLPTINQVRLHTAQLQYPGEYEVSLIFESPRTKELGSLKETDLKSLPLREYFPSIDELEAKDSIKLSIG